jgi:hypothetical protein
MRRIVQMGRRAVYHCQEDKRKGAVRYRELWKRWIEQREAQQNDLEVAFAES